jgi:hypothetical protein
MPGKVRTSLTFLFAACLISGCGGGNVNKASFDQVKNDMSLKEVEGVLGTGAEISTDDIQKLPLPEGTKIPFGTVGSIIGGDPSAKSKVVKWRKWGDNQKFILVGFIDDKVYHKLSNGL